MHPEYQVRKLWRPVSISRFTLSQENWKVADGLHAGDELLIAAIILIPGEFAGVGVPSGDEDGCARAVVAEQHVELVRALTYAQ
eukprot:CAMPEP_0119322206 /NCGR_PEP_ID=MMETSP1333-20130426/57540_1 /TAXON_ID=418940 /ORGANISM="Scyphosphaera apsteinii, Strain RCC1455" /LENGTH=83 /DNA_ID=CAMNT_0007329371 /DNA_START=278 /DNA_END=529 /DNA_ORIENTATION=-